MVLSANVCLKTVIPNLGGRPQDKSEWLQNEYQDNIFVLHKIMFSFCDFALIFEFDLYKSIQK